MTPLRFFQHVRSLEMHPLSRQHHGRATSRFLAWQIGTRLLARPVVVPLTEKASVLATRGMSGITCSIYTGLHDFEDMAFCFHLLRPTDVFIDVGANIGSYTILASKVAGARSISFEPDASTFASLRANVRLNEIEHLVTLHEAAVASNRSGVQFTVGLGPMNHVVADTTGDRNTTRVPSVCLDDVVTLTCPSMLKIDVEGFEADVLDGAKRLVSDPFFRAAILETGRHGPANTALDLLLSAGFIRCEYDPFTRQLRENKQHCTAGGNSLLVRDMPWAEERLQTAAPVTVLGDPV